MHLTNPCTSSSSVLCVSPVADDHARLQRILSELHCKVISALSLSEARQFLANGQVSVVLCERELFPGSWREILEEAIAASEPPNVIVTSRQADEGLWVEALNIGAYDVLPKPFEPDEVLRVLNWAMHSWVDQHRSDAGKRRTRRAA